MMLGLILGAPATEPTLWMITLYGVIGQILVFLVLAVLIGIIYLVRLVFIMIFKKDENHKNSTPKPAEINAGDKPAPAMEEVAAEDEIAAVIGAVLAVYCSESGESGKHAPFKVKKIYKIK